MYDAAGNRIKTGGTFARSNIPPALSTTNYNANNQQLTFATTTETYDLNGNLATSTDAGVTTTYTWNARNQLTGISKTGFTASFTYDSFGRRTGRTVNGTVTNYVYDGLNPVQEKAGATVNANLLTGLGIDEFFTRTDGVGVRSLLPDALGSTVALGDNTGTLQTQYTYEPFGFVSQTGASSTSSYKYTGREDDGSGLSYYRARYYQPRLQRFIAEDPVGFASGDFNLYAFLGNNPTNDVDPLGHTKGGKKNLSVTHDGQILNKQSTLSNINAAIADAQARGMSQKHIEALKALRKVIRRGGTLGICGDLLIDQILLEIEGQDAWLEYCTNDPNCL
jgi:RHS repeat-associated protein